MANIQTLEKLGFDFVGGMIDRQGKNYGFLSPEGPVLTPEGEAIVAEAVAERMTAEPEPNYAVEYGVPTAVVPRRGRPPKVV